jgi:exosortase A-associated hydrolase 1
MTIEERALAFRCHEDWLYGVVSLPPGECTRGVLIVVGGPQYRAGSHRQFTLLARSLAQNGIAAMRFDYRGMGDSQGEPRDFLSVEDDLRAAIDAFTRAVPGLRDIVLWGLCDGASASVTYAATDARVRGLVLLNPWVRTDNGIARTTLKHYYRERLMDAAFWRDVLRGKLSYTRSLKSMLQLARMALGSPSGARTKASDQDALPDRMYAGMHAFDGPVLVVLSGADLTAREFCDLAQATPKWQRLLGARRVTRFQLDQADHTFSRQAWRDQVARWTGDWMRSW